MGPELNPKELDKRCMSELDGRHPDGFRDTIYCQHCSDQIIGDLYYRGDKYYWWDQLCDAPRNQEVPEESKDMVNSPEHYTAGGIETIDVLEAKMTNEEFVGYCIGNTLKYLLRRHHKGASTQDIEKGRWYLDRALLILRRNELSSD